jgi:hypothetical protein
VQAQAPPRQQFDGLLQGADGAGQHGEGVGLLEHPHLALMHGGDDDGLDFGQHQFLAGQEPRDDAQHPAAGAMSGAGAGAHETDAAAAINQAQAFPRQGFSQKGRSFEISRLGGLGGAAVNAYAIQAVAGPRHFRASYKMLTSRGRACDDPGQGERQEGWRDSTLDPSADSGSHGVCDLGGLRPAWRRREWI